MGFTVDNQLGVIECARDGITILGIVIWVLLHIFGDCLDSVIILLDLFEYLIGLKVIGNGIDKLFLIDTKVNWFFRLIRWVNTIEDVVAVLLAGLVNAIGDFKAI